MEITHRVELPADAATLLSAMALRTLKQIETSEVGASNAVSDQITELRKLMRMQFQVLMKNIDDETSSIGAQLELIAASMPSDADTTARLLAHAARLRAMGQDPVGQAEPVVAP